MPAPPCSTGCSPATTAANICCGSRIPTRSARPSEAIDAILDGLDWLGISGDGEPYFQSQFEQRHAEVAHQLLDMGAAYRCYMTQEELAAAREKAQAERKPFRINSPWRDRTDWPEDRPYVIRIKAPQQGDTVIDDLVQGRVTVANQEIDDFILLRSDGTPTYMLAVVVDDFDMGVTHVIRGDDHLNNAFRQLAIIRAMGWPEPAYAHVPLIHGFDGAKLSKRHGALGVDAYRDELGILPEALFNYLLRSAGAMATMRSSAATRPSNGSTSAMSARARRASTSRSWRTSTAITCARPTTPGWRLCLAQAGPQP